MFESFLLTPLTMVVAGMIVILLGLVWVAGLYVLTYLFIKGFDGFKNFFRNFNNKYRKR